MMRIERMTSPLPRECSTTEPHGQGSGAGEGNRTLATSLEGWGSTIELHPQIKKWSEQQDSNLRPPGPKPGALPNCAMPRYKE